MTWPNCREIQSQAPDWWHLQTHTVLYAIQEVNMTQTGCTEVQDQAHPGIMVPNSLMVAHAVMLAAKLKRRQN